MRDSYHLESRIEGHLIKFIFIVILNILVAQLFLIVENLSHQKNTLEGCN